MLSISLIVVLLLFHNFIRKIEDFSTVSGAFPRTIILFLGLVCIYGLASCGTSSKTRNDPARWIPHDFDPKKMILLVGRSQNITTEDREMEAYMTNQYPYRFEFVGLPTLKLRAGKYADTTLYRYGLVYNSYYEAVGQRGGTQHTDFNFYDRRTGKDLPGAFAKGAKLSTQYKNVIEELMKHLNTR